MCMDASPNLQRGSARRPAISMDRTDLSSVTPEFLARLVLHRREQAVLTLPERIEELDRKWMEADQKATSTLRERERIDAAVAGLKSKRNGAQVEARRAIERARAMRQELQESGQRRRRPEPSSVKADVRQRIQRIQTSIETEAGDHKRERKLLDEMKQLKRDHDAWVEQRRKANLPFDELKRLSTNIDRLIQQADEAHEGMIELVEERKGVNDAYHQARRIAKDHDRARSRAREALELSIASVERWNKRINAGIESEDSLIGLRSQVLDGASISIHIPRTERNAGREEE